MSQWTWRFALATLLLVAVAAAARPAPAASPRPLPAAQKFKEHQATGTVKSISSTRLILIKQFGRNKTDWTFQLTGDTKMESTPAKGARVTIYYHEEKDQRIADRIRVRESKPPAKAAPPNPS